MKRLLLLTLLSSSLLAAFATGPIRRAYSHTQKDGTKITVYQYGDGFTGYYATLDGITLLQREDGDYYYAAFDANGELNATEHLAHNAKLRSETEKQMVVDIATSAVNTQKTLAKRSRHLQSAARNSDGTGTYGVSATGTVKSIGNAVIPFVMVSFPDRQFLETTTREKVTRLYNEEGYADEPYCVGSVADYFKSQSHNLFRPQYVVVDEVTVSREYSYYGKNSGSTKDAKYLELVKEVIDSVVKHGIPMEAYLVNQSDGTAAIPLLGLYYAGPGEHSSYEDGHENYLWAKFATFSYTNKYKYKSVILCNETLQDYQADENGQPVLVGPGKNDGIGITCHEFSHALGLPDFYKTSAGAQTYCTMEYWSVMDYGQYWRNSYAPIGYNAYERNFLGWLKFHDLETEDPQIAHLYHFDAGKDTMAFRILNPDCTEEYYILENRQVGTWYPEALGTGMLVTHIDYLSSAWSGNSLNNTESHQRFEFVPADGVKQSKTFGAKNAEFRGDLYPGTENVTGIETWKFFNGDDLQTPILNIKEETGVITFHVKQDLTGINPSLTDNHGKRRATGRYTLDGRRIRQEIQPQGTFIERYSDGTTRIVVK